MLKAFIFTSSLPLDQICSFQVFSAFTPLISSTPQTQPQVSILLIFLKSVWFQAFSAAFCFNLMSVTKLAKTTAPH